MATYDPIMDALLAYLQAQIPVNTFLTYRRGIVLWPELSKTVGGTPVIRQPALFVFDGVAFGGGTIHYEYQGRQDLRRTIARTIIIYAQTPVAGGLPGGFTGGLAVQNTRTSQAASILHPLIEAVEKAITTPDQAATDTLTLGGLVAYCRIEGRGELVSPDIDENGQGMATLPIEIRIP